MTEFAPSSTTQKHPWPDARGRYGEFGGKFVPETLMYALGELEEAYRTAQADPAFQAELADLRTHFIGRETPLYYAKRLTEELGGAKVYFKREDLAHTGAHKINNALGQCLLAKRMGKKRIIAETGAGQHGVATATACALLGLECVVYMGSEDIERQKLNVFRMRLLGSTVVSVDSGSKTLKDAINDALRDWVTNVGDTHYVLGTVHGPHPFPMICRDFQSIIGQEARRQIFAAEGRLPNALIACVGGGSNAIGLFHPFLGDEDVKMVGVEAGGHGIRSGEHAARFQGGKLGVLQGTKTWLLADEDGQIELTHSISAGLDYAAVGPEHAYLKSEGRADYSYATDDEALAAFQELARTEGIIPALETSHALAHVRKVAPTMAKDRIIVVSLSGRGDKDVEQAARHLLQEG